MRVARERKELTQVELAERVGCHVLTVKRWEHGTHKPGTPELAQQLADVLAQPLESLFPPDAHAYVRDARARYPTTVTEIPDPRDVLATLRPGRPARPVRLVAALALLATTAAILAAVAVTGSRHDATPGATTGPAQVLTPAVDAIHAPARTELAATTQAEPAATTHATRARRHARTSAKRLRQRRGGERSRAHRRRAHRRRRAPARSPQPTYTTAVNVVASSQPVAARGAGAGSASASSTTATTPAPPTSSSPGRRAPLAPDEPNEFGGP